MGAGVPKIRGQQGFTLLEMLVALVILSFGLLGLAGLQAVSLRNNTNAYQRSQANVLAYDIVDRMRANRSQAVSNAYNIALGATPSGSGVTLADLQEWRALLVGTLPNGDGAVSCTGSGLCTVTVQWDEIAAGGANQQILLSTQI